MQTPRILGGPHGAPAQCLKDLVTPASATNPNVHTPIAIGSFLSIDDTDGLRATEDADAAIAYQVDGIVLEDGVTPKRNQYLTADEANSGSYRLAVFPLGGCLLEIEEDGDGGVITDADLAAGKVYADLVITAPTDYGEAEKNSHGVGRAYPSIKIDSSGVADDATGKVIEITGVNRLHGTIASGQKRVFECKVISTAAQAQQP